MSSKDYFFLLSGYSGCGKTTIAENIVKYSKAIVLAPTNSAKNNIKEKINSKNIKYATIHSVLFDNYGKETEKINEFKKNSVYVIDECSLIDEYILKLIIQKTIEKNCKVIFIGDSFQLEPVGQNPNLFKWENVNKLFKPENKCELDEVKRYDGTLLKIATELRINKKPEITNPKSEDFLVTTKFNKELLNDIKNNQNSYVIITATNEKRVLYNKKIRAIKYDSPTISDHAINDDHLVSIANTNEYANGEIFKFNNGILEHETEIGLINKNNVEIYKLLIYNMGNNYLLLLPDLNKPSCHTSEILDAIENKRCYIPSYIKSKIIRVLRLPNRNKNLKPVYKSIFNNNNIICTYGYSISCHKAQGQEWNNVYIDFNYSADTWDNAKWIYTAITRAKNKVQLIENKYLLIK